MKRLEVIDADYNPQTGESYAIVGCGKERVTFTTKIAKEDDERLGPAAKRLRGPQICVLKGKRFFLKRERDNEKTKLDAINNFLFSASQDKRFDETSDTVKALHKQEWVIRRRYNVLKDLVDGYNFLIKEITHRE